MTEIVGLAWLVAGLGGLSVAAWIAASALRLGSFLERILAAYLLAWGWLVALTLALSPFGLVTRGWLVAGIAAGLAGTLGVRVAFGPPPKLDVRTASAAIREALAEPGLLVLAIAVAAGGVYSLHLGLFTPVNEGDSLAYHLARAAFWMQQQRVGYVPGAVDLRLDVSPPNAEIGQLATMLLSGGDRYVALPQLLAYAALVACVAGIARRIGLDHRAALFGALVFATLPVVVVQASGALNDLVVASFLATAAFFALGRGRRTLVVAALAVGLALGTKVTAVLALPTLAIVAAAARPRSQWPALAVAGVAGVVAGSVWYVVNLVETGALDGGLGEEADQQAHASLSALAVNAMRYALDLVDVSGATWPYLLLYPAAALALALLAALRGWSDRRAGVLLLGGAALTATVLALPLVARVGREVVFRSWAVLGRPPTPDFERGWGLNTTADPTNSWYGPLGLLLLVVGTLAVVALRRRRHVPRIALVLSLGPWILLATLAATVVWDHTRGRFLVFGIALAAATWGLLLRWRALAAAVSAIAVVTLALSLLTYQAKPSGIGELLDIESDGWVWVDSIWDASRVDAQFWTRGTTDEPAVVSFVEASVPEDATIAVSPRENDFLSPYFGARLTRRVLLVPSGAEVPAEADWLVLSPGALVRRCGAHWRRQLSIETGWAVERRTDRGSCPTG